MKTAASFLGLILASRPFSGHARPEATPGKQPVPSVLAMLKPRQWTQGPPLADLSNHLRRDIGLDPVPSRDRWSDHRI
jgi:hypothetical protein